MTPGSIIIEMQGSDGKPAKSLPHTFWQRPSRKELDDRIAHEAAILDRGRHARDGFIDALNGLGKSMETIRKAFFEEFGRIEHADCKWHLEEEE